MFRSRLSVISDQQLERIHQATLELLERTGVQITCPQALELLDGAGAQVNGSRVRILAWKVEDAIRQAPLVLDQLFPANRFVEDRLAARLRGNGSEQDIRQG